ncbi:MAG: hypothetical protein Q8P81_02195 [Nanoarchaeota archaeon]|nr:hypothetical protein [Nanoarchaeota archaeon]
MEKKQRSLEELAQIEKAIEKKYGSETTINPNANWTTDKEKNYLIQLKNFLTTESKENIEEREGYSFIKHLINRNITLCPICDLYGLTRNDELYMLKYDCCEVCYIKYVDGREEFWNERKKKLLEERNKEKT